MQSLINEKYIVFLSYFNILIIIILKIIITLYLMGVTSSIPILMTR